MNRAFDAESAVIGSILIDERCIPAAAAIIKPADMEYPLYQKTLEIAFKLYESGQKVDPIIIAEKLGKSGNALDQNEIIELFEKTPTAANVEVYAKSVKENAIRRQLKAIGDELTNSEILDPFETMTELSARLKELEESRHTATITSLDMISDFLEYKNKLETDKEIPFVETGYRELDRILGGGMLNEGLYILAARPGMGKTTFALNIADNIAKRTGGVLFVSLEMSAKQLSAKRFARETHISGAKLLMQRLTQKEYEVMAAAADKLAEQNFHINRKNSATVSEIASMAGRVDNLACIVVDYMQLIRPTRKRASRYEEVTEISGALKSLARRMKVPVLCLAQLSRETEKVKDKRPTMAHLRDSGAIEQDADGIIFLHRADYYDGDKEKTNMVEMRVIVAKNRHAATGEMSMAFYPATSTVMAMYA